MELQEFYSGLMNLEARIHELGLHGSVVGRMNWYGDSVNIEVTGREPIDANGNWTRTRRFSGAPSECERLITEAEEWIAAIPSPEDRAIDTMIKKLNQLAESLPKGGNDIARAAWEEIHKMLIAKAEQLARNGLPSPARISEVKAI